MSARSSVYNALSVGAFLAGTGFGLHAITEGAEIQHQVEITKTDYSEASARLAQAEEILEEANSTDNLDFRQAARLESADLMDDAADRLSIINAANRETNRRNDLLLYNEAPITIGLLAVAASFVYAAKEVSNQI